MRVFIAVMADLFQFVCGPFTQTSEQFTVVKSGARPVTPSATASRPALLKARPSAAAIAATPKLPLLTEFSGSVLGSAYVITTTAEVLERPLWAFDSVCARLGYGMMVTILGYQGRFARIRYETGSAWVLKDQLSAQASDALPQFNSGTSYLAADSETKKLRRLINDDFFTAELYLPLLGVEYVTYRLQKIGLTIKWSAKRPRPAGSWQQLLKGQPGVTIKIAPKTGSIMEYQTEIGVGVIGYVEAVTPNETVTLASVGRDIEGQYLVETLTKEVWQALRPVWLQIQ